MGLSPRTTSPKNKNENDVETLGMKDRTLGGGRGQTVVPEERRCPCIGRGRLGRLPRATRGARSPARPQHQEHAEPDSFCRIGERGQRSVGVKMSGEKESREPRMIPSHIRTPDFLDKGAKEMQ